MQSCIEYTRNNRPYIQPYRASLVRKPRKVATYKNVNAKYRGWGLSLGTALTHFPRFLGGKTLCRCQGLVQGVIDSWAVQREALRYTRKRKRVGKKGGMGSPGKTSFFRACSTYRTVRELICYTKLAVNTHVASN